VTINPTGCRFPPALRLRKTREFERVYAAGRRARGRLFLVVTAENRLPFTRLGLSVGKRVGGAVRRNKIKRILREAFRRNRHRLPVGLDLVVVAEAGEGHYPYETAAEELVRLTEKALASPQRPRRKAR
jgi:ribonuclease P protein component